MQPAYSRSGKRHKLATGPLRDVMEDAGAPAPSVRDREGIWKEVWRHVEAMGLVVQVHHSSREPTLVDRVTLTDFGSDPASWDD